MQRRAIALGMCFLLPFTCWSANRLVNPGFEDEGTNWGEAWSHWGDVGTAEWAARDGSNGVAFYPGWYTRSATFDQQVFVTSPPSGEAFVFSIDALAETNFVTTTGVVRLEMQFWGGGVTRHTEVSNIYSQMIEHREQWDTYWVGYTNTDTEVEWVKVRVRGECFVWDGGTNRAFWDNAVLESAPLASPFLSLGGAATVYRNLTGEWTVSHSGSTAAEVIVALQSGDPLVASVPTSVVIASGASSAVFRVAGVSVGSAEISATASGYTTSKKDVSVIERALFLEYSDTLYVGSSNRWVLTRAGPLETSVVVTLQSEYAAIAAVDSPIELPTGASSVVFYVRGVSQGRTTISASAPEFSPAEQAVSANPMFLMLSGGTIYQGTTGQCDGIRCGPVDVPLAVELNSDNPGVAVPQTSMLFEAASSTAVYQVTGVSAGIAHIQTTATGYSTVTSTISVLANTLILQPSSPVLVGSSNQWSVCRTGPLGNPATVALNSSVPAVAAVGAGVVITAQGACAAFEVQGMSEGTSTITATSAGYEQADEEVGVTENLLRNAGFEDGGWGDAWFNWGQAWVKPWAVRSGGYGAAFWGWTNNGEVGFGQSVELALWATGAVYVLTIDARADDHFESTGQVANLVLEFWRETNLQYAVTNNVFEALTASRGTWNTYSLIQRDTDLSIDQATVRIVGQGFYPTGDLSAAMWDNARLERHELCATNLLLTGVNLAYEGSSNQWAVTRLGPLEGNLPVALDSDDSTVASVDTSVVVGAGFASAVFRVRNKNDGRAKITAQASGYIPADKDIVVNSNTLTLAGARTVYEDLSVRWQATRSGPAQEGVAVSLASDAPDIAAVPSSVVIQANSASAVFHVQGIGAGAATIAASATGLVACSRGITVTNAVAEIGVDTGSPPDLSWMGLSRLTYTIQEADTLTGGWSAAYQVYADSNGVREWADLEFTNSPTKFYRILTDGTNAGSSYGE